MSQRINQPVQSVRLTNVAVVRINRHGKRFEIACYRNKVVNYRQGLETDLSEVLQTDRIFVNVSKGQFAKKADLQTVFGTSDQDAVARLILEKGTLQVSDLERSQQLENTTREVANWVATNCVHPASQRPYTTTQIRDAMRQAEFKVNPSRSIKPQYLDCVKLLQSTGVIPIERAKMELALVYPALKHSVVQDELSGLLGEQQQKNTTFGPHDDNDEYRRVVVLVDPSLYRPIDELAKQINARLEILRQAVTQEGDANLESEMERKKQSGAAANSGSGVSSTTAGGTAVSIEQQEEAMVEPLVSQIQETLTLVDEVEDRENNKRVTGDEQEMPSNSRKNQKKAQKQSKKAKRREKEQLEERQARIEAERRRQEERAMARGMQHKQDNDTPNAGGGEEAVKSCNTCGGSFPSLSLYRAHFRSDWHRYNVKLKMKGVAPVSEKEFILCDSDAFFEDMA